MGGREVEECKKQSMTEEIWRKLCRKDVYFVTKLKLYDYFMQA